ncbi:hypothetical protein T459_17552 [Capsicum annuum]|uniref:Uncharacterized protein n=1 Tax=Capsicum annuum TaxID=4072 RepID=A0A2G2ZBW1_CAPAN|nr:hypothetical protein T459_17552 [Capsicum annuum]
MSGEQKVYYDDQWKQHIPPGFRFAPTDAELLQHYLRPKFNDYVVCRIYKRQIKDKGKIDEEKDLIDSLIGPKPFMTDHNNNGEAAPVLPSTKRKLEPNNETITCDHPHAIAMAMNSNYFYASHKLHAATMLEGVLGVEGISDQARATEYMCQQNSQVVERQNSGLVDHVEIGANDAQEGPRDVTTRRVDELDCDNIHCWLYC